MITEMHHRHKETMIVSKSVVWKVCQRESRNLLSLAPAWHKSDWYYMYYDIVGRTENKLRATLEIQRVLYGA